MNLASLTGPKAFGRAYRRMLDNDPHAPVSADREIVTSMIRLCDETARYLYEGYTSRSIGYVAGTRSGLERFLGEAGSSAVDPGPEAWYTNPEQFTAAGIANYHVRDAARYDYTRAVLSMADRGWAGGLRWLHGELDEVG